MFKIPIVRTLLTIPHYRRQYGTRTPWRRDTTSEPSVFIEENFAKHTLFVLDVGKRFLKFSFVGLIILGTTAATAYEGIHLWVENVELASESDDEVKKWEWDREREKWSGDGGGTDSGLGFKGRHSVRAAWMAHNWGVGYSTAVIGSEDARGDGLTGPGGLNVIDARLQRTEDFLRTAISIAEKRASCGTLNPRTLTELIARRATILERLGPQFLPESRELYARVWDNLPKNDFDAARVAAKLGDLHSRLGQADDALLWWRQAIQITRGEALETLDILPKVLYSAPSSPYAQRLLSNVLVSLSAFYAKSGQLHRARSIQETSLNMLRSIRPPESLATASPPQALHALYLLQRSALFSVHLAEVLHAEHKPAAASIQWLTSAAQSSERVAHALAGHSPAGSDKITTSQLSSQPLSIYTFPHSMRKASNSLLRDARRTAAEAWNLMGILNETQAQNLTDALRCYERAVEWAGTPEKTNVRGAAEGTLESEWSAIWNNYTRVKQMVDSPK